jgi:hypothetical protein
MSMDEEFDRSFQRFRVFLNTEPVIPLLSRNLSFLLDENRVVDSIEVGDGLKCFTSGRKIVIGGAPYLMRDDCDRRHWIAGMRIALAHEVQHDNSSDRTVLDRVRSWFAGYLRDGFGADYDTGAVLGQKFLNMLEDGRVNNIVCQRFPGYVSMMRFVNFALISSLPPADGAHGLRDFLNNAQSLALTGIDAPGAKAYPGTEFGYRTGKLRKYIDSAAEAESAGECGDICMALLSSCADYLAALCAAEADLPAFLRGLGSTLEEYQYSDADRAEQKGDGTDGGVRRREPDGREGRSADEEKPEDSPDDKGDSGSPGSGDNSTRQGDENGSLTGQEAKPKSSAGSNGREDSGRSLSDGRSSNHGMTGSGRGMHNSPDSASAKAREEGPQSIGEVLGAEWSEQVSPALEPWEIDDMLRTAGAELDREAAHRNESRVEAGGRTPLSMKDMGLLRVGYPLVEFKESAIAPRGRQLPPEYLGEAKALHKKIDRILREQRVRTANQRKGSLSQKALWKSEVNDPDIFQRKSPPTKYESAFYLLIDRSGSMGMGYGDGNSKLFTALMTAAVIEEALKGIAYTKVVAFDGGYDVCEHVVIKDFNQKELGSRCFDALSQVAAGNGNKDGYSIRVAAMDLEKRNEKRKVLIVLSDGLPSAYSKEAEAMDDVRSAVQDARRKGVIVIPIMYGVTDTEESYESYRQMYEKGIISTTSDNILDEFEKLMMKLIK